MRNTPMSDKEYEEDRYAHELAAADAIKKDPKMMAMARKGAKRIAKKEMIEAKAMQKIAKLPTKKSTPKKSNSKKSYRKK